MTAANGSTGAERSRPVADGPAIASRGHGRRRSTLPRRGRRRGAGASGRLVYQVDADGTALWPPRLAAPATGAPI